MKEKSGLYIHVPFCKSKCVYCGFYSIVNHRDIEKFLSALSEEMSLRKEESAGKTIRTV